MPIRIKAAPGHRVRDEHANLLPVAGIELEKLTPYWVRRLRDDEIIVEDVEASAEAEAPPATPEHDAH